MENIMKNTKRFLYVIVAILSSIVTSQQYAMLPTFKNREAAEKYICKKKARLNRLAEQGVNGAALERECEKLNHIIQEHNYRYEDLRTKEEFDNFHLAKIKEMLDEQKRAEQVRKDQLTFETSPDCSGFFHAYRDSVEVQKSATEQKSQPTQKTPINFEEPIKRTSPTMSLDNNSKTPPTTKRVESSFRPITPSFLLMKKCHDGSESPFAQFAAEGKESPFDEKNAVINTNSSTQSPMEQVAAQSLNPRTHSSTNYEETISESGSDLFREGEDDTPFSMNIEQ